KRVTFDSFRGPIECRRIGFGSKPSGRTHVVTQEARNGWKRTHEHRQSRRCVANVLGKRSAILRERRSQIAHLRRVDLASSRQASVDLLADLLESLRGLLVEPLAQPLFPQRDDDLADETVAVESERQLVQLA